MDEKATIEYLNSKKGTKLIKCTDEYNSYDAEDKNYIVEIKNRRKYYPEKLIECIKLLTNYQKSQLSKKIFIYVVTDEKGIYVFNITFHIDKIIHSKIVGYKCPATTDFSNNEKITKYSFLLSENLSIKI